MFGTSFPADALLDRYVERGGQLIDVAVHYAGGASEATVGDWLRRRGGRDGLRFLAKGCHPPLVAPEHVGPQVERTRELLGLEQVDCFVLHRDDEALGVDEWGDALLEQLLAGTVATVGVSNWSTARTLQLRDHLRERGRDRLVLLSNHTSLAELQDEPWPGAVAFDADAFSLPEQGVVLLAWSSLASGYFVGADAYEERVRRAWHSPANAARRERAGALAHQLGVAPTTVALAWLLGQPGLLAAIGPETLDQLEQGLAAEELELSAAQRTWLRDG
jgi:aryl-alcohol dehydrogenase-like predicted oxidoreductase